MADLPIGMQLQKIHHFLKTELIPYTSNEIFEKTGIDIDGSPDILTSLTGEKSGVIRDKKGKWRWASKYRLQNINDLISLMARSSDGVGEKDLYDSYRGVKEDIKKLKKRGLFYEIKSGSRIILFTRDPRLDVKVSDEVKKKYKEVRVPDPIEVHRYLVANGLKKTDDKTGVKIAAPVARKRPSARQGGRRRNRRIKLTNTHMEDSNINLDRDFVSNKASAFN